MTISDKLTPEERAAHDEDPRPGAWAGERGADLRRLSQDETDILIRRELIDAAALAELDDVERACGSPPRTRTVTLQANGEDRRVTRQRGGLDSDPLVRLLAYRAWGDRDRDRRLLGVGHLTGLPMLDRVLNGGLVDGSTTLLVGRPGVGKSTLTLQVLDRLRRRCLYVTGEETREHVVARARRVGAMSDQICVLSAGRLEEILERAQSTRAQVLAIETIQMLSCGHVRGRPGLPAQLRSCVGRLIDYARTTGTALWLVGHLTARGDVAGPRAIVHDVDVVLRLDQQDDGQILRCSRNRFGPTHFVGRLELTTEGFVETSEEACTFLR